MLLRDGFGTAFALVSSQSPSGDRWERAKELAARGVATGRRTARSCIESRDISVAALGRQFRLQQALAQVESLKRALASSQQAAIAAQHLVEVLTKATGAPRSQVRGRDHELTRSTPPYPTWNLIDGRFFAGTDPGARQSGKRILPVPRRFQKGEVLFRFGDKFDALYAIRYGSCKTVVLAKGGHDQIAGFYMVGEVVGMDGIASELHECEAIALEDMEGISLAVRRSRELRATQPRVRSRFAQAAVARMRTRLCRHAHAWNDVRRTAGRIFLARLVAAVSSPRLFIVRVRSANDAKGDRELPGPLKLETVSRILSQFQRAGMLQVEGRNVKLRDRAAVSQLIESV